MFGFFQNLPPKKKARHPTVITVILQKLLSLPRMNQTFFFKVHLAFLCISLPFSGAAVCRLLLHHHLDLPIKKKKTNFNKPLRFAVATIYCSDSFSLAAHKQSEKDNEIFVSVNKITTEHFSLQECFSLQFDPHPIMNSAQRDKPEEIIKASCNVVQRVRK